MPATAYGLAITTLVRQRLCAVCVHIGIPSRCLALGVSGSDLLVTRGAGQSTTSACRVIVCVRRT